MYHNKPLVDLLSEILGLPKSYGQGAVELQFNCPSHNDSSFFLAVNTDKKKFQCWGCEYRGPIERIINEYGNEDQKRRFRSGQSRRPKGTLQPAQKVETISLGEFRSMRTVWEDSLTYRFAAQYLRERKIDKEMIDKWDICYSESGKYRDRVIIPTKNINGKIEYFVARDVSGSSKLKYRNPQVPKSDIIFGEKFIDWKKPVILTEGVFDAMVLPNSVPILGSKIDGNTKLIKTIRKNRTPIILGFDDDKVGLQGKKKVGKFLESLGITLYILPKNEYNDLANAFQERGKDYLISLIRGARPYDELDLAIQQLMME